MGSAYMHSCGTAIPQGVNIGSGKGKIGSGKGQKLVLRRGKPYLRICETQIHVSYMQRSACVNGIKIVLDWLVREKMSTIGPWEGSCDR